MVYFETILTGIIVGLVVAIVSAILNRRILRSLDSKKEDIEKQRDRYDAVVEGVKSLLHDLLYHGLEKAYFRGVVGYDEFENLAHLIKPYERLGGNGTAKRRFEHLDELPRVYDSMLSKYDKEAEKNGNS